MSKLKKLNEDSFMKLPTQILGSVYGGQVGSERTMCICQEYTDPSDTYACGDIKETTTFDGSGVGRWENKEEIYDLPCV